MTTEEIGEVFVNTWAHYQEAKKQMILRETRNIYHRDAAISDRVPGFSADRLEFGSYDKADFAVLFVDMRDSTTRAQTVGAQTTFLTMHVYLTALLEVVKYYDGKVIDIMGDGIMAFWKDEPLIEEDNIADLHAVQSAGLCGRDMLKVREKVINRIIEKENLGDPIDLGVGVTFGSVIVTKIGIKDSYDVKAFGDCINIAAKYSSIRDCNKVRVSPKVADLWPRGENGKITFSSERNGDSLLLNPV